VKWAPLPPWRTFCHVTLLTVMMQTAVHNPAGVRGHASGVTADCMPWHSDWQMDMSLQHRSGCTRWHYSGSTDAALGWHSMYDFTYSVQPSAEEHKLCSLHRVLSRGYLSKFTTKSIQLECYATSLNRQLTLLRYVVYLWSYISYKWPYVHSTKGLLGTPY